MLGVIVVIACFVLWFVLSCFVLSLCVCYFVFVSECAPLFCLSVLCCC